MPSSEITLRQSQPADAPIVAAFCQPIYAAVYPNEKYGLEPEHFSPEIFQTPDTLAYFAKTLTNSDNQLSVIARDGNEIVGTISIERLDSHYEIHAFYVAINRQGQGIGRQLLAQALKFVTDNLPVRVEVAETNVRSLDMYKHLGFQFAPELGEKFRHWPEWPEGIKNRYIYLQARKADIK